MTKVFTKFDYDHLKTCRLDEVGHPWEERWSILDMDTGACRFPDVGTPKPKAKAEPEVGEVHPLLEGLDPNSPDTDRAILRRLYHADPKAFLNAYGTAGVSKLMDIAVKEGSSASHPEITDTAAWNRVLTSVAKAVGASDNQGAIAPAALLLAAYSGAGGTIAGLRAILGGLDTK